MSRWADLSAQRAKFRLSGPDRVRYLNGQVSNQVDQDLSEKAILACVCNLKGKVEGLLSITAGENGDYLLIDGPIEQRETLFERLDRYLIADDCEFEDVTDDFGLWHCLNEADGATGLKRSERFGVAGGDLWTMAGEDFSAGGEIMEADELEGIRIENGFPKWGHELTGDEFPAEVGLDRGAVDFHKGCYLGQEIVSRIESVGKVKRTLVFLVSEGDGYLLKAGQDLVFGEVNYGKITSVAHNGAKTVALGLVKRSFTELADEGKLPEGLSLSAAFS